MRVKEIVVMFFLKQNPASCKMSRKQLGQNFPHTLRLQVEKLLLAAPIFDLIQHEIFIVMEFKKGGRRGGLMFSALDSGLSDPGSSLGRETALCS